MADFEVIEVKKKKGGITLLELEDGTIMKIQLVIVEVARLNQYTPQGEPIYRIVTQDVVSATFPKELRRKPLPNLGKNEKMYG